jgi:hypothetical protein
MNATAVGSYTELELANLRTQVAVDIGGILGDMVEDVTARCIIVADIVECWARLEPSVRDAYDNRRGHAGIAGFGGDYADEVDRVWRAAVDAEPFTLHDHVIGELSRLAWCIHIAQIQWRNVLGQPPPTEWLTRFSSPFSRP